MQQGEAQHSAIYVTQEEEISTLRTALSRRSSPDCGRHRAAKEELTSSIENEEEQIKKEVKRPETTQTQAT